MIEKWFDTAENTTPQIVHIVADNMDGTIRYLTEATAEEKCIKIAEAKALGAAGLRLGFVFEAGGGAPNQTPLSAVAGAKDAAFVLQYLGAFGVPNGLCIFFAADNDFNASQIQTEVIPYYRAIATVFSPSPYKVGAYGSGAVC